MTKTQHEMEQLTEDDIVGDFYRLLKQSELAKGINGSVYRCVNGENGTIVSTRPRDSKLEDAEVMLTAGLSGQIQDVVVTIRIFVKDIDSDRNGTMLPNLQRLAEVQQMAKKWVETLTVPNTGYLVRLDNVIRSSPMPEIQQHFVPVKLRCRYSNDGTDE